MGKWPCVFSPFTQTDAVGRMRLGNMKVFEVSLFMPVAVKASLYIYIYITISVSITSLCTQKTPKDLQLFLK